MEKASPNQVRWGILGTADIARGQTIPGIQQAEHCALYAVAGRRLEKAKQYQEEFGFEKAYGSYDELLADPAVQAVYVPLPNDIHREWTEKALRAGKHVLCEKPLAMNENEVREMFRTAEENGVILMEAFAYLHSPFAAAIKTELDAGTIGEVRYFESAFLTAPKPATDFRFRKENGGGAAYDLGCYPVSMLLWLLGREPDQVMASAKFSEGGVDLFTSMQMLYDSGLIAHLDCGMMLPAGRMDRFHLFGTKGEIHSPVEFNQCGEISYTVVRDGTRETKTVTAPNNYALESDQLSRCILYGEKPHITKEFSLMAARTTDRVLSAIGY